MLYSMKSRPFTHVDVLKKAKEEIEKGPLPDGWNRHGSWCPWCAIAKAKGELDEQFDKELSMGEILL